jgi:hypothetical protein
MDPRALPSRSGRRVRVIRQLLPEDAEELTALLVANREAFVPVMPDWPHGYYTAEFQRERLTARAKRTAG